MAKPITWRLQVRRAIMCLHLKHKRLESWAILWTSPFYSSIRRYVLRKEDAEIVWREQRLAFLRRHDRIARRYLM